MCTLCNAPYAALYIYILDDGIEQSSTSNNVIPITDNERKTLQINDIIDMTVKVRPMIEEYTTIIDSVK